MVCLLLLVRSKPDYRDPGSWELPGTAVPWHCPLSATGIQLWKTMSSVHVAMMINIFSETSLSEKCVLLMSGHGKGYVHCVKPAPSAGLLNTPTAATDIYRAQWQHPESGGKPEQLCSLQMQRDWPSPSMNRGGFQAVRGAELIHISQRFSTGKAESIPVGTLLV